MRRPTAGSTQHGPICYNLRLKDIGDGSEPNLEMVAPRGDSTPSGTKGRQSQGGNCGEFGLGTLVFSWNLGCSGVVTN